MNQYKDVLEMLDSRLEAKHEQYGTSYKEAGPYYMFVRLLQELQELEDVILSGTGVVIDEALDVAICALLIADIFIGWMKK